MRKNRFMVWIKHKKKMLPVRQIHYGADGCSDTIVVYPANSKNGYMVGNSCELMQSTGLLDKNGKEIYEGYIIKVTGEFAIDDYGIVKWSQQEDDYTYHCGFMVDWQEEVKRRSHLSFWANYREIEIIGNIYENPELLKEATL